VSYLFDTPQFQEHGAIFWPDYVCWTLKPEVWQIFGMDWMMPRAQQEVAFESVQYLIDKTRCWRELRMAL
jgi:alpha 1,2-mannosyltransferase